VSPKIPHTIRTPVSTTRNLPDMEFVEKCAELCAKS
jgi:hypothetical protein